VGGAYSQQLYVIERAPEGPRVLTAVPVRFVPLLGEQGYAESR
jgi:hypothetical protein